MSDEKFRCDDCGIYLPREKSEGPPEFWCPCCRAGKIRPVAELPPELKFRPTTFLCALHAEVLIVAKTRIEGEWKAYCGPVRGEDHGKEAGEVLVVGDPIEEAIARAAFPYLERIPYAR